MILTGERRSGGKSVPLLNVHHKTQMDCSGIEPGPPQCYHYIVSATSVKFAKNNSLTQLILC
jgi:hypothetical protein